MSWFTFEQVFSNFGLVFFQFGLVLTPTPESLSGSVVSDKEPTSETQQRGQSEQRTRWSLKEFAINWFEFFEKCEKCRESHSRSGNDPIV